MHCNSDTTYSPCERSAPEVCKVRVAHISTENISIRAKPTWTGWGRVIEKHTSHSIITHNNENRRKKQENPLKILHVWGRRCHATYDLVLIWSTVVTSTVWKWLHSRSLRFCSTCSYFSGVVPGTRTQHTCIFDRTLLHANHYQWLLEAFLKVVDF